MGHADYRTTARYLHYRERGDEAARLAEAFAPVVREVETANGPTQAASTLVCSP
jgi:hypothetical protein